MKKIYTYEQIITYAMSKRKIQKFLQYRALKRYKAFILPHLKLLNEIEFSFKGVYWDLDLESEDKWTVVFDVIQNGSILEDVGEVYIPATELFISDDDFKDKNYQKTARFELEMEDIRMSNSEMMAYPDSPSPVINEDKIYFRPSEIKLKQSNDMASQTSLEHHDEIDNFLKLVEEGITMKKIEEEKRLLENLKEKYEKTK